jgi:hypothetical protein
MPVLRYFTAVLLILIVLSGTFLSGFLIGESNRRESADPEPLDAHPEPADRGQSEPFSIDSLRLEADPQLAKEPEQPSFAAKDSAGENHGQIEPFSINSLPPITDPYLANEPERSSSTARDGAGEKLPLPNTLGSSRAGLPGPVKRKLAYLSPPGLAGAFNGLLKALRDNPSSYQVEVIWDDPLSGLEVHFEYRRDTQMLTKWDGALWEQWRGLRIRDIYTAVEYGYPLTRQGNYTYAYLNPMVTESLRTR